MKEIQHSGFVGIAGRCDYPAGDFQVVSQSRRVLGGSDPPAFDLYLFQLLGDGFCLSVLRKCQVSTFPSIVLLEK